MDNENMDEPLIGENASSNAKGERQPDRCRDLIFGVMFYGQLLTIIVVACTYGAPAVARNVDDDEEGGNDFNDDFLGIFKIILCCGGLSLLTSLASVAVMISCSRFIIQVSLLFSVVVSLIVSVAGFSSGNPILGGIALFSFLSSLLYAFCVRKRIPFAAANLSTGLCAVRSNCGLTFIAYFVVVLCFVYTIFWALALIGAYDQSADCGKDDCENRPNIGILFLVLLAYFWTQQVMTNIVHVTVAGTVGNWWFKPNESSCFSKSIFNSFRRAITFSFGSICFGSLFVAITQALRMLVEKARQNDEGNNCLLCICNCILACVECIFRYFNKWAYVYVGVYGYSFISAAKHVVDLFKEKGWNTIINDDLVTNALWMVQIINALLVGCLGQALSQNDSWFNDNDDVKWAGFVIGFVVGIFMCGIMFGVVESSVNTVLVLFAEAPFAFKDKHPELFDKMTSAWSRIYPDHLPTR